MICQNCNKNQATIHVTDVFPPTEENAQTTTNEHHLCEVCAQAKDLPHAQSPVGATLGGFSPGSVTPANVWKLLQITAAQTQRRKETVCKGCGMSVDEFRTKGRLGCAQCYEAFRGPIAELLERVHGALEHVGRVPGLSDDDLERMQNLSELRRELDTAIRDEAYESAADLRDRISDLEEVDADSAESEAEAE